MSLITEYCHLFPVQESAFGSAVWTFIEPGVTGGYLDAHVDIINLDHPICEHWLYIFAY